MNTADRSIAPLGTALRRRFRFEHQAPDPEALAAWQAGAAPDRTAVGRRIDLAALLAEIGCGERCATPSCMGGAAGIGGWASGSCMQSGQ
ncbi:hypothetical protein [uncultured Albimonas sp.]|uniref:hypothetical protein n=1 Tax=uncultured Albimonas sp. TaxID=1331701 RepID=UPI0030EF7634